ncbi:MAG: type II secretion system protein N [Bermanella sp.]
MHWSEHKSVEPAITLVKWLLCLCLAYQGAALTWLLIDSPALVLPEPSQGAVVASQDRINHDMAAWDLFGQADAAPMVQAEINAPKTRLRLVLMGVLMATNKQDSSAIIAEQGREGAFFKVGERVQGRARLSQVYNDKVILDNSGKLETLTFADAEKLLKGIQANKKITKAPHKPPTAAANRKSKADFKRRLRGIRTPEKFVDFAKQQLEDPTQAMTNMGLRATGDGYILTPAATMLMSLGMKAGDKLISVNGYPLGDPVQDKTIIDEVYASGNASIVIERGSRRMTINHSF